MAHDAFISYSAKDILIADAICAALEKEGLTCWIAPRDILPSKRYGESIINAIRQSRAVVLLFSPNANESPHIVQEVDRAFFYRKPIIPIRVQEVALSDALEYYLCAAQWQDALTPPIQDHLSRLTRTVKTLLAQLGSAVEPRPQVTPATTPVIPREEDMLLNQSSVFANQSRTAPIVLVHGILGFNQLTVGGLKIADYFRSIPEALRNDEHVVPVPPNLKSAGSVAEGAQNLKDYLQDQNNVEVFDKKVHIVAHSMGGLDARFMISKLGMADRVLSLTTIGTPHHGSPIADIVIAGTNPRFNKTLDDLGIDIKSCWDLTMTACRQFNDDVSDAPGISYFSIAGQFNPHRVLGLPQGTLGLTHDVIARKEGDNDGLVSVESATLAERPAWTALDVWEANHFRMINWGVNLLPTPHELADNSIVEKYRSLIKLVKGVTHTGA